MEQIHNGKNRTPKYEKKMTLYTDGGCKGNEQEDLSKRVMISAVTDSDGVVLVDITNHGGSNNIAEFIALEHAIEYAIINERRTVKIYTDSTIIINWFKRDDNSVKIQRSIDSMNDPEWYRAVKTRIDEMKRVIDVDIEWVGRDNNLAGIYLEKNY